MSQITSYSWDEENRLTGVVNADSSTEAYTYAGDGKRRSKDALAGPISYVWDDENVLQEMNGSTVKAHYTDSPGYWGDLTSFHTDNGDSFYYLFDQQASTREVLGDTSGTVDTFVYRAFGEKEYELVTTESRHQFQGEVGVFWESNGVWMGARHYFSAAGSWTSLDINRQRNSNLYMFVNNNPVSWVDPLGLDKTGKSNGKKDSNGERGKSSKPTLSASNCWGKRAALEEKAKSFCELIATKAGRSCVWSCLNKYKLAGRLDCLRSWCKKPKFDCWTDEDCKRRVVGGVAACAVTNEVGNSSYIIHVCRAYFTHAGCQQSVILFGHEGVHGCGHPGETDGGKRESTVIDIGKCIGRCKPCKENNTVPSSDNGTTVLDDGVSIIKGLYFGG